MKKTITLALTLALALSLVACGGDTAPAASTPTPASSSTPAPASTGTPAPASSGTSAPASSGTSAPASSGTSAPASSGTSAPASSGTPAPASSDTPAPASTDTPAPASSGIPASSASASAAPEVGTQKTVVSTTADLPRPLEIKITGNKTAIIVFGGADPTQEMNGTRWGVQFDNGYTVQLDIADGYFDCATWNTSADGSLKLLTEMDFSAPGDALILHADFGEVSNFNFNNIKRVTAIIDEEADGKFRYSPITVAMTDIVVSEITLTDSGNISP